MNHGYKKAQAKTSVAQKNIKNGGRFGDFTAAISASKMRKS